MYLTANDQIIHETIDGEAMIVNLIDGTYYSTAGSGAFLWPLIVGGHSIEECVRSCQSEYDCSDVGVLSGEIERFVSELLTEGLILENVAGKSNLEPLGSDGQETASEPSAEFVAPILHKYSDMQDLLLLDPIHDVDESGWPHPKNGVS